MTQQAEAVIFVVFASGAVPERFGEVIKKCTERDLPIFLVSDNHGESHGILHPRAYATSLPALDGGATPIEKYNVNSIEGMCKVIGKFLDQGKRGQALAEAVSKELSYQPGEQIPVADWEDPQKIHLQRGLTEQTLRRAGLQGAELESELKKLGF